MFMQDIFSSPEHLAFIGFIFFFGGFVKGAIGFGLPNIAIGSLTLVFGISHAILLTLFPMLISNIVQAFDGPHLKEIFKRIWLILLPAWIMTYLASQLLKDPNLAALFTMVLGLLIIIYSLLVLMKKEVKIPRKNEKYLSPIIGAVNGTITGFTGTALMPSTFYLKGLGFKKDVLIQAMGVIFGSSTIILILSLGKHDMMQANDALYSSLAVIPAIVGMVLGRHARKNISNDMFTKIFLYGLIALGALVITRSIFKFI